MRYSTDILKKLWNIDQEKPQRVELPKRAIVISKDRITIDIQLAQKILTSEELLFLHHAFSKLEVYDHKKGGKE